MTFLRDTHLPVAHRICQVVSSIRKLVWLKLSKRLVSERQMPTFVTYAEIVRVQCYQGRNVEMGYIRAHFGKR